MKEASPRFRQDLATAVIEADGVPCVDVRDPKTGTSFRLYDFEYQLALQLNGQPVADVVGWASSNYGVELTDASVTEFASRLRELGFLEGQTAAAPATANDTLEVPVPNGPIVDDSSDSAADEWASPQGAKTATFIPDAAMLSSPDATPVSPIDLPLPPGMHNGEGELAAPPREVFP